MILMWHQREGLLYHLIVPMTRKKRLVVIFSYL